MHTCAIVTLLLTPMEAVMALREIELDVRYVKTYATEESLRKRLNQDMDLYPDHDDRFVVVRTPEGRWTAIIQLDMGQGRYAGRYEFLKI